MVYTDNIDTMNKYDERPYHCVNSAKWIGESSFCNARHDCEGGDDEMNCKTCRPVYSGYGIVWEGGSAGQSLFFSLLSFCQSLSQCASDGQVIPEFTAKAKQTKSL